MSFKIDATIKLIEGIDPQEFFDSLPKEKIQLYTMEGTGSLDVRIHEDFFNTVSEHPQVVSIANNELLGIIPTAAPTYPPLRYQQGIGTTSVDPDDTDGFKHPRPESGSTDNIATQKTTIHNNEAKLWLGSHFMGAQLYQDKPHRYNDPTGNSTRPTIGICENDTYLETGPYAHTLNPATEKTDTQYESRFFGKNVDIIFLEAGNPNDFMNAQLYQENLRMVNHPEFGRASSTDLNILGNDSPSLGDAPTGNYVHTESRIILKDWGNQTESSGSSLGGKGSLLSRYNNTNLSAEDRKSVV